MTSPSDLKAGAPLAGSIQLKSSKDWELWIQNIKDLANQNDLWPYLDPAADNPPALTESVDPNPITYIPADAVLPAAPNEPANMDAAAQRAARLALLTEDDVFVMLSTEQLARYKAAQDRYQSRHKSYLTKKRAIMAINTHILNTASAYSPILVGVQDPRERLKALKGHVAPSQFAQQVEIRSNYALVRTQAKHTKTEEWLKNWENALRRAQAINLPEVQDVQPTLHFLKAVEAITPQFSYHQSAKVQEVVLEYSFKDAATRIHDGFKIAQLFKEECVSKAGKTQGGIFTTGETLQGESPPARTCILKHPGHTTDTCFALNPKQRRAGYTLRLGTARAIVALKSNLGKKYAEAITEAEALVAASAATPAPTYAAPAAVAHIGTPVQATTIYPGLLGPVAIAHLGSLGTFNAIPVYPLYDSVILDCGSSIHATNKRSRLSDFTPCQPYELHSAGGMASVVGHGTMQVTVQTLNGPGILLLREVALIESLPTSLVSHKRLIRAGYSWHDLEGMIVRDGVPVFRILEHYDQYIIEYNDLSAYASLAIIGPSDPSAPSAPSATPVPTARGAPSASSAPSATPVPTTRGAPSAPSAPSATLAPIMPRSPSAPSAPSAMSEPSEPDTPSTALDVLPDTGDANPGRIDAMAWHLRLGHPSPEVLQRVLTQLYGKRITSLSLKCEPCRLAKATRQINRTTSHNAALRPLGRICIDLFELEPSINKMVRALVIKDEYTGYIWVYPLPDKSQESILKALRDFGNLAVRQWNLKIMVIRRDNEQSLGSEYETWIKAEGITDEPTPIYTKQPNGGAERSGGVMRTKSTAMRIAANLPSDLWPYMWTAAAFIYNRTPRDVSLWKSPLEMLLHWLRKNGCAVDGLIDRPDLTALRAYGCKAYPLREEILRDENKVLRKTQPRAHIGYLVGYAASNIYDIWVPSQSKVIRTRDVTFEETEFYEEAAKPPSQEPDSEDDFQPLSLDSEEESESDAESTIYVGGRDAQHTPVTSESDESDQDTPSSGTLSGPASVQDLIDYPTPDATPEATPAPSQQQDSSAPASLPSAPRRSTRPPKLSEKALENLAQISGSFHLGAQHRMHRKTLPPEPTNWAELLNHPFYIRFLQAASVEWDATKNAGTVNIVPRSQATSRPIPLKWVFKYKYDKHGFLVKFKARICVRGDLQPTSDKDTYAATLAGKSFRMLMALAARWDLQLRQLDAVNAFQNADLDEDVFVELPDGFKQPGCVARLLHALYGLRRSPLLWQQLLSGALASLGLKAVLEEPCLFTAPWIVIFFYVDDIVCMFKDSDTPKTEELIDKLQKSFEIRDLGELRWFLGIRIVRDRAARKIWLTQDSYIDTIANRFSLADLGPGKGPATPYSDSTIAVILLPFEGTATPAFIHLFQRKVGSIMYPSVITRPDVSWVTCKLAQFLQNPSPGHMEAVNRVIQYLYSTKRLGLLFNGNSDLDTPLEVFTDASFADDMVDRKSTQGFLMKLYEGPIAWQSGKQSTVTTSSTEAELLALTSAGKTSMETLRLFNGIRFDIGQELVVQCDNQQTIRLVTTNVPRLQTALRHVDIHTCWARQAVLGKSFMVEYLQTSSMAADGFTKALSRPRFAKFIKQLGMEVAPLDGPD